MSTQLQTVSDTMRKMAHQIKMLTSDLDHEIARRDDRDQLKSVHSAIDELREDLMMEIEAVKARPVFDHSPNDSV